MKLLHLIIFIVIAWQAERIATGLEEGNELRHKAIKTLEKKNSLSYPQSTHNTKKSIV